MFWTDVPEAAIHENYEAMLWKCEVGFPEEGVMTTPAGDSLPA